MPGRKRKAAPEPKNKKQKTKTEEAKAADVEVLDVDSDVCESGILGDVMKRIAAGDSSLLLDSDGGVHWASNVLKEQTLAAIIEKVKSKEAELAKAVGDTPLHQAVTSLHKAVSFQRTTKSKKSKAIIQEQEKADVNIRKELVRLEALVRDFSFDGAGNMLVPLYPDYVTLLMGPFVDSLSKLLRNDSLIDISSRHELYHHVFAFMNIATKSDSLVQLLRHGDNSPIELLLNMAVQGKVYLQSAGSIDDAQTESTIATDAAMSIRDAADRVQSNITCFEKKAASPEEVYEKEMTKYRFELIDMKGSSEVYPHAHKDSIKKEQPAPQTAVRRMKEISTLATSLPVSWNSGIFLRVDETRTDVMKALIIGPESTPYANGCFSFDIYLPPAYPQVPPKVMFMSTSNGRIRMNPNLYANGKVCLSLLGTWDGPAWKPGESTLLQVLLSIQGMILVKDPYYNEPGMGKPGDDVISEKSFSEHIKLYTCVTGIIDQLQHPDPVFKDIVMQHFRLKKAAILEQLKSWLTFDLIYPSPPANFCFPHGRFGIQGNKESPQNILTRTVGAVSSLK
eukprot:TRINITY_DN4604_c0_g1_i1.p1 TRINITY_DN4604_c0_g1~~TRINITY_DN4604_c0_g1_i1.p1  ORF type:complete len:565 (+),score=180.00 TRINITY_DN4604_c0_g1_i1:867-2561(+)